MGYNPLRKYRGSKLTEIVLLITFSVVIATLVLWATR